MPFRVSDNSIFQSAVRNVRLQRSALADLQQQVGTGKRINSLGDDPADATRVLSLKSTISRIEQFERNIDSARTSLERVESTMNGLTNTFIRLRELAVSADDPDFEEWPLIQEEVEQLFDDVFAVANTRTGNTYLFGGRIDDTAPFTRAGAFGPAGAVPTIGFVGEPAGQPNFVRSVVVGEGASVQINVHGRELFLGDADGDGTTDAGRVNVFTVMSDFRNALQVPQDKAAVGTAIENLKLASDQVIELRARAGARLNRVETTETQLQSLKLSFQSERSELEDADIIEVITNLQARENTFQAALAVTARILPQSLLDFIR